MLVFPTLVSNQVQSCKSIDRAIRFSGHPGAAYVSPEGMSIAPFVDSFLKEQASLTKVKEIAKDEDGDLSQCPVDLLYSALLWLPSDEKAINGQHNRGDGNWVKRIKNKELDRIASAIIQELSRRYQFETLEKLLQNPWFAQSRFRKPAINVLVNHNDPWRNYVLSQTVKFPMPHNDQSAMQKRKHTRGLKEYAAQFKVQPAFLDGKTTVVIGGGTSPLKRDSKLPAMKIKKAHIINIDKFFPKLNPNCEDEKIGEDFFSSKVAEYLKDHKAQVVLASYSLPMYIDTEAQVGQFYKRALSALNPGGTFCIFPAVLSIEPKSDGLGQVLDYDSASWMGLNDNQTLSRAFIYQTSQKAIEALKKRPDLFYIEESSSRFDNDDCFQCEKGVNITLIGDPKKAHRFLEEQFPD